MESTPLLKIYIKKKIIYLPAGHWHWHLNKSCRILSMCLNFLNPAFKFINIKYWERWVFKLLFFFISVMPIFPHSKHLHLYLVVGCRKQDFSSLQSGVFWPALGLGGMMANVCSESNWIQCWLSEQSPDTGFKIQARFSSILLQQMAVNISVAVQAQVKLVEVMWNSRSKGEMLLNLRFKFM